MYAEDSGGEDKMESQETNPSSRLIRRSKIAGIVILVGFLDHPVYDV